MNKNQFWILIAVIVLTGLFGIMSLGEAVEQQTAPQKTEQQETVLQQETAEQSAFRSSFVDGCSTGASREFCGCAYDYLVGSYGVSHLFEMDNRGMTSEYSAKYIKEAIQVCEAQGITL